MTTCHGDSAAVVRHHPVQLIHAAHERRTVGQNGTSAVLRQRGDDNRLPGASEHVNPLVTILQREVHLSPTCDAASAGHEHPDVPLFIRSVAPAGESVLVGEVMPGVVGGQLLGPRQRPPRPGPSEPQRHVTPAQLVEQYLLRLGRQVPPVGGEPCRRLDVDVTFRRKSRLRHPRHRPQSPASPALRPTRPRASTARWRAARSRRPFCR